jgi:hypothetical protein
MFKPLDDKEYEQLQAGVLFSILLVLVFVFGFFACDFMSQGSLKDANCDETSVLKKGAYNDRK